MLQEDSSDMGTLPTSKRSTIPALQSNDSNDGSGINNRPCLVVLEGVNQGRVFPLNDGDNLLGRDDGADVRFTDEGVSRRHALITCEPGGAYSAINDLASSNGTTVNDEAVTQTIGLKPGDKVMLGAHTILRFSMGDEIEARYAEAMYQAVLKDGLTGVFNRRYFDDCLMREVSLTLRHATPLALIMVDIDHFKSINDNYEHRCGDAVLKQLAALLERIVRTEDVVARYGGEEFAVICRETTERQGAVLAERLRRDIQEYRFAFEEHALRVTISLGVAQLEPEGLTCEALISAADLALIEAKEQGRNRVVLASYR